MFGSFSLAVTRERRAHSVVQVQELLTTHQTLEHDGNFLADCPQCRTYRHDIEKLSISAESLLRFQPGFNLNQKQENNVKTS